MLNTQKPLKAQLEKLVKIGDYYYYTIESQFNQKKFILQEKYKKLSENIYQFIEFLDDSEDPQVKRQIYYFQQNIGKYFMQTEQFHDCMLDLKNSLSCDISMQDYDKAVQQLKQLGIQYDISHLKHKDDKSLINEQVLYDIIEMYGPTIINKKPLYK